jgi:uncharacterized membrane protein YccC
MRALTAARSAWTEYWDRFAASDPGLLRLQSATTVAGSVLLALGVLALMDSSLQVLVVGGLLAMVASFAVTDPRPLDQARSLVWGLPVTIASLAVGTVLFPHRVAADIVFVAIIFVAVYARRFGPRGTGLGMIAFQCYFVSQFAHVATDQLPRLTVVAVIGFAASAFVRFGLVRNTPARTLARLRRAFGLRMNGVIRASVELITGSGDPQSRQDVLERRTKRLHQCALMIQARINPTLGDPHEAVRLEIRISLAEVAAERFALLISRVVGKSEEPNRELTALAPDLEALAALIRDPAPAEEDEATDPADDVPSAESGAIERLLDYRDSTHTSGFEPAERDVYQAVGELTQGVLGLRATRGDKPPTPPSVDEAREELEDEEDARTTDEARRTVAELSGVHLRTTRLACQVAVGTALAILGGELLSEQRWYWAVLTCWVVFVNASSTGEILVKGYRRLVGTVAGVLAGGLLAGAIGADPWLAFALVIACVFGMFFTAPVSYSMMSFFVTTMIGLLYTLLGTFSRDVLVLRIEETAVGAACGLLAATLVLPIRLDQDTDERLCVTLDRMAETVDAAITRLVPSYAAESGFVGPAEQPLSAAGRFDAAVDALRLSMAPVIHPANPLRPRRQRAIYLGRLLDGGAYHARALAALAQATPEDSATDQQLAALVTRVGTRVRGNAELLAARIRGDERGRTWCVEHDETPSPRDGENAGALPRALRHLHRIDEALTALADALAPQITRAEAEAESGTGEPEQTGNPAGA